jgi:hypothetical protein
MAITLALSSEKDLEGRPALFVMLSTLPNRENQIGLGAQRRTFHFAGDLIEALVPAGLEPGFLGELANDLEQGRGHMLEISNEQAWSIGMLPQRDGSQWVRVTIGKITSGDGSPRYSVSYQVDNKTVDGTALEDTLGKLERHVRPFVALDWAAIEGQLEQHDASCCVLFLPDESVRYIFEGEL